MKKNLLRSLVLINQTSNHVADKSELEIFQFLSDLENEFNRFIEQMEVSNALVCLEYGKQTVKMLEGNLSPFLNMPSPVRAHKTRVQSLLDRARSLSEYMEGHFIYPEEGEKQCQE